VSFSLVPDVLCWMSLRRVVLLSYIWPFVMPCHGCDAARCFVLLRVTTNEHAIFLDDHYKCTSDTRPEWSFSESNTADMDVISRLHAAADETSLLYQVL
jgi:hypothetical protein